jgi:hypothetical protein
MVIRPGASTAADAAAPLDALGPAGGARRVLQQITLDLVVDRCNRLIGNAFG